MADVIEPGVVGDGVAEVHADALVDLRGHGVARGHLLLHHLQLLGRGQALVQLDARGGGQLDHRILGEVLHTAAVVAAPLVHHGGLAGVHRDEGQLIEPTQDVHVLVHKARGLAGAHGDAQDVAAVQIHGPGQGGHVAVVGHLDGDILPQLPCHVQVHGLDVPVEVLLAHLQEQGGHHDPVVNVHARAGHADGVHPGHMGGGGLHGLEDTVVVVLGVGLQLGEPHDLLAVDALAVHHRGDLPVAAARVKADAAAVQVTAHTAGGLTAHGHRGGILGVMHLEGPFIHRGHEVRVKGPGAAGGIGGLQVLIHHPGAGYRELPAAPAPQKGLHQTIHQIHRGFIVRAVGQDVHAVVVAVALVALHVDHEVGLAFRRSHPPLIVPQHDGHGHKLRIQGRLDLQFHFSHPPGNYRS